MCKLWHNCSKENLFEIHLKLEALGLPDLWNSLNLASRGIYDRLFLIHSEIYLSDEVTWSVTESFKRLIPWSHCMSTCSQQRPFCLSWPASSWFHMSRACEGWARCLSAFPSASPGGKFVLMCLDIFLIRSTVFKEQLVKLVFTIT